MRGLFAWLGLAAVAVAVALWMGQNDATVTVFWLPHRVDLSLNLVLVLLLVLFVVLYLALRSLALLRSLPQQARQWRLQQRERMAHAALVDALSHQLSGRFVRARSAALEAVSQLKAAASVQPQVSWPRQAPMEALAHLLAAEAAHTLQDHAARDRHVALALAPHPHTQTVREGALLRAIRWAVEDRNPEAATRWLDQLSQGAARRTLALRLRLRVARMSQDHRMALDTARLLAKHRAFSKTAARSILRGLVLAVVSDTHDIGQLESAWATLDAADRQDPDVVLAAVQRLREVATPEEAELAQRLANEWLVPMWDAYPQLSHVQRVALVQRVAQWDTASDTVWLARAEDMQRQHPADPLLQHLAAEVFFRKQLWGKAAQLFQQASRTLPDPALRGAAWHRLAQLAEQRGDHEAALLAWKQAAQQLLGTTAASAQATRD